MTERCDAMSVWVGPSSRFGGGRGNPALRKAQQAGTEGVKHPADVVESPVTGLETTGPAGGAHARRFSSWAIIRARQ